LPPATDFLVIARNSAACLDNSAISCELASAFAHPRSRRKAS
jgi:hypothetical protein